MFARAVTFSRNWPSDNRVIVVSEGLLVYLDDIWVAHLLAERWHFAFDSGRNYLMNPSIASVQIM